MKLKSLNRSQRFYLLTVLGDYAIYGIIRGITCYATGEGDKIAKLIRITNELENANFPTSLNNAIGNFFLISGILSLIGFVYLLYQGRKEPRYAKHALLAGLAKEINFTSLLFLAGYGVFSIYYLHFFAQSFTEAAFTSTNVLSWHNIFNDVCMVNITVSIVFCIISLTVSTLTQKYLKSDGGTAEVVS